jgi:predicted Rdx family selenoprotein
MSDPTCTDCAPPALQTGASRPSEPEITPVVASKTDSAAPAATAPTDPAAFEPPRMLTPHVVIEFCDRCRWCVPASDEADRRAPRASWTQTELMLTFPPPLIASVTLQPHNTPETAGRFRVWLDRGSGFELVWDRKVSC